MRTTATRTRRVTAAALVAVAACAAVAVLRCLDPADLLPHDLTFLNPGVGGAGRVPIPGVVAARVSFAIAATAGARRALARFMPVDVVASPGSACGAL